MKLINCLVILPFFFISCEPQIDEVPTIDLPQTYEDLKLGLFVHYMHPAKEYRWGSTTWVDGSEVKSLDELADNLDVEDLAETAATMRAQYVIFTTWHANMNALYPSEVIPKWMPNHTSKRDLIADLITALKRKNIKLILYIHPSDGHDFTEEDQERTGWNDPYPHQKWNDFINDVVAEVADRYGDNIFGFFIDGGIPPHTEDRPNVRFDPPRLRKTLKDRIPNAVLIQNSGLNETCVDVGAYEGMKDPWPASDWLMCQRTTKEWWAMSASVTFSAELAYKYTVLQAAVSNTTGGGAAWSFGPHPGGRWEIGVTTFTETMGELVDKAGPSLLGSKPSTSFITEKGTPLIGLQFVATESQDGEKTYVHVFNPPIGDSIILPLPENGKKFSSAMFLNGEPIKINSNSEGIELSLKSPKNWDDIDTIIELK